MNSKHLALKRHGFTLIEGLLAGGLSVVLIGCLVVILIQFQRGFSKGEEAASVLNEAGCFLSFLRYDLINAVCPTRSDQTSWERHVNVSPNMISFSIYSDDDGTIVPVAYVYEKSSSGGTIRRVQGAHRRTLIDQHVASLTWFLETDVATAPGLASEYRQIWISVDMSVFGHTKFGGNTKEVSLETKIFPTRLHRQLNSRTIYLDAFDSRE